MKRAHFLSRLILILGTFLQAPAGADTSTTQRPPLEFDTKLSVVCRDVTPLQNARSSTRIVEAKFRISANLSVSESLLEMIVYNLSLPECVVIEDYLPKTELGSDAGAIFIRESSARRDGETTSVRGGVHLHYAAVGTEAEGSRRADKASEFVSGIERSSLPQKQLIMAAGTKARATQLYFKLRPFSQITLEGEREFACLLSVPTGWKGDCLKLECTAILKGSQASEVEQTFGIGLYLPGDDEAQERARVEKLAKSMESITYHIEASTKQRTAVPDEVETGRTGSLTALYGKWAAEANPADVIEFLPDGTMIETVPLGSYRGTFKQRNDGGIDWEMEGLFWGKNQTFVNWTVEGDHLTLVFRGLIPVKWTRCKNPSDN